MKHRRNSDANTSESPLRGPLSRPEAVFSRVVGWICKVLGVTADDLLVRQRKEELRRRAKDAPNRIEA